MESKPKTKGSWGVRFLIIVLSVIFGILLYWLLGFITQDIGTMQGPDYKDIRSKYVDAAILDRQDALEKKIQNLSRKTQTFREQQGILRRHVSRSGWWVAASAAGWGMGILGLAIPFVVLPVMKKGLFWCFLSVI